MSPEGRNCLHLGGIQHSPANRCLDYEASGGRGQQAREAVVQESVFLAPPQENQAETQMLVTGWTFEQRFLRYWA